MNEENDTMSKLREIAAIQELAGNLNQNTGMSQLGGLLALQGEQSKQAYAQQEAERAALNHEFLLNELNPRELRRLDNTETRTGETHMDNRYLAAANHRRATAQGDREQQLALQLRRLMPWLDQAQKEATERAELENSLLSIERATSDATRDAAIREARARAANTEVGVIQNKVVTDGLRGDRMLPPIFNLNGEGLPQTTSEQLSAMAIQSLKDQYLR